MRFASIILAVAVYCCAIAGSETKTVRDFGAVGDGKADDTVALMGAVDNGGSIVLPKGVYRINRPITIDLDKAGFTSLSGDGTARVVMAGAGPAFRFVGTHEGSAAPKDFKENVWERQRMPVVRGIEIVGAHEQADGLEFSGIMELTVCEVNIRDCRHAIHLTQRNRNIVISNCHLYHNRGCGVFYDDVNLHQSNITGSHISYNNGGGVVLRGGDVRNVQIGTCDIESNMAANAPPTANVLIDCTGGSIGEVAITGCTLQHNNQSAGSANIRVMGRGQLSKTKADPTQEGHIAITGNVFSDVKVNIHLDGARGVSISGNTFWEGFEHDLLIENSQSIVIGPNDFDRNPRYVVNGNWSKDLNGLTLRNCSDCKLNGLLVKGVWGKDGAVVLEKCQRCTITDCSILDCDGVGLQLTGCSRCKVSECKIRDDRPEKKSKGSLKVEGGTENWIKGNVLSNGASVAKDAGIEEGNRQ